MCSKPIPSRVKREAVEPDTKDKVLQHYLLIVSISQTLFLVQTFEVISSSRFTAFSRTAQCALITLHFFSSRDPKPKDSRMSLILTLSQLV